MEHLATIFFWFFFSMVVSIYVYRDAANNKIVYPERWGVLVAFSFFIFLPLYFIIRNYCRGTEDEQKDWNSGYSDANPALVYIVIFMLSLSAPAYLL